MLPFDIGELLGGGMFNKKLVELVERFRGVEHQLDLMCEYMNMPRRCNDSEGNALKVGDVLSGGTLADRTREAEEHIKECGASDGGEEKRHRELLKEAKRSKKKVLEVGWRWAVLSDCYSDEADEEAKSQDGRWYEKIIKGRKWVRQ